MRRITLVFLTAFCLSNIPSPCRADVFRDPALDAVLEKIKADYGVSLHYAEGPRSKFINLAYSLADPADVQALEKIILLFVQEISLYPEDFFRGAHFRDIYFVQKLFYEQKPVEGLFSGGPNFIFYDYARSSGNTQKIRHYIHHELFHMIGSKHPFWEEHAAAWTALNRGSFSYNQKYSRHERNPVNYSAPPEPGFITEYAMASPEEDRAEVFACMMLPEELSLMKQWAQKDGILLKKFEMMKEFRREIFLRTEGA